MKFRVLIFLVLFLYSCGNHHTAFSAAPALEERIFVVNIVPGDGKLNEYLNYHQHIWPEVEAGFKAAGYKKITLARFENLVVMTVTVPAGANLDSMSRLAESHNKACVEWNRLMTQYQTGVKGTASGQKWVEAKTFYSFRNE